MALDSVRLKDNIIARIFFGVTLSPADQIKVDESWTIISEEIIAEIKRGVITDINAEVFTGGSPLAPTGDFAQQTGISIT